MILAALSATAHDLAIGLLLAAAVVVICALMVRSLRALRKREDSREEQERAVDYDLAGGSWTRYRGDFDAEQPSEAVVPQAGKRAA